MFKKTLLGKPYLQVTSGNLKLQSDGEILCLKKDVQNLTCTVITPDSDAFSHYYNAEWKINSKNPHFKVDPIHLNQLTALDGVLGSTSTYTCSAYILTQTWSITVTVKIVGKSFA